MSGRDWRKMWCSDGHRNANRWRTGAAVAIATVPIATVSIATVPIAEVPIATAPRPRGSVRRLADVSFVADPRQRTLQTIALKATSDQPLRGWGPRHRGLGSACWPFWFWRWSSAVLNTARTTSLCGPNAPMRAELRSLVCQPLQPPVPGSLLGLVRLWMTRDTSQAALLAPCLSAGWGRALTVVPSLRRSFRAKRPD